KHAPTPAITLRNTRKTLWLEERRKHKIWGVATPCAIFCSWLCSPGKDAPTNTRWRRSPELD
ncbi:MAG: hypothetical protein AAF658_11625, partial [Myxococcota bacterium]